jgi:hypothetical protein
MGKLGVLMAILMDTQIFLDFTPYQLAFTDVSEKHVYHSETSVNIHRLTSHNIQEDTSIKIFIICTNNIHVVCIYKLCTNCMYELHRNCRYELCANCMHEMCTNYVRIVYKIFFDFVNIFGYTA